MGSEDGRDVIAEHALLRDILSIVRELALELHPGIELPATLGVDDSFDGTYALDSLARAELFTRLEQRLGLVIPESALALIETPRDLLQFAGVEESEQTAMQPGDPTAPIADVPEPGEGLSETSARPPTPDRNVTPPRARITESLHAWYSLAILLLFLPPIWVSIVITPGLSARRRLARAEARMLLRLLGIRVDVAGLEHLPAGGPWLIAANHASYVDGVVLTAILPPGAAFVAKRDLLQRTIPRLLLQRLGALFVERSDAQQGIEDTRTILEALRRGEQMIFFPEGTFTRTPGLLPFRLGAFVVASEAAVPIVPVAIGGTRAILLGDQWRIRRGTAQVTIAPAIAGSTNGWSAMIALRDRVRAEIGARCGEPMLSPVERVSPPPPNSARGAFLVG